jgi:hypothetical protein
MAIPNENVRFSDMNIALDKSSSSALYISELYDFNDNVPVFGPIRINDIRGKSKRQLTPLAYPPVGVSNINRSTTTHINAIDPFTESGTVSGQSYGNGTYTMTLSSGYGGLHNQGATNLIDYNPNSFIHTFWDSTRIYNSPNPINYAGTTTTNVVSIGNILGEYFQYQLPTSIKVSRITFDHTDDNRMPKTFTIVASNDGTTWNLIYDHTSTTWTANVGDYSWTPSTTSYTYYRVIVTSLRGGSGNVLNLSSGLLYGVS